MYKPAPIREFVTRAVHKRAKSITVNNRFAKEFEALGEVRGKFKQKGTAETNTNGLTLINEKTTFITWYKKNTPFAPADILTINGTDYEIVGKPENVEMRNRYVILTLEVYTGGA